ncbi:hypothetical protein HF685_16025 [Parasphingorhabdus halotolerans]|uniref:Uncharacterized protein n=1 Tax=Parasphingorhabdus halotolerans TaxID=2725558 RepID=A0A6H2DSD7_9SPHN|nr:hypothetical protein HF685_16025 [Parasphingorhabdus halotolerans]
MPISPADRTIFRTASTPFYGPERGANAYVSPSPIAIHDDRYMTRAVG